MAANGKREKLNFQIQTANKIENRVDWIVQFSAGDKQDSIQTACDVLRGTVRSGCSGESSEVVQYKLGCAGEWFEIQIPG